MNTKSKFLIAASLFCATIVSAQQQPASTITLGIQQAIDTGLKNRYDVQSKKYDIDIASSEVQKTKKEWLPEITGSGNVRYSPQLQATYIPGGFVTEEPALAALGANSLAVLSLDLDQPIYKPGIATDVKIAQTNAALAQERIRDEENTVKEQIIYSYLNVLLKNLQAEIAANEEARYGEYASVAEGKFRLGTLIETDYMKTKLDYENAKVETRKAKQNYELALTNLKYQINVPADAQIILTDSINSVGMNLNHDEGETGVNLRTEIRQLKLRQETDRLEINKTKQHSLPSISLYGNYSRQFTYSNPEFTNSQWWSSFNYVGLKLSIPITSNFKNHNSIHEARTKSIQTELNLQQKIADVNYEIQKAQTELSNAKQNMEATQNNYELSKEIYKNQRQQYDLGAKQYYELLETNRSLNQAEQNYVKAVYDYLVASVSYEKAIGIY